jgi:hypothetical protein
VAIEALRRFAPGFENARLRTFGMTLGTRDSRQLVGRGNLLVAGRCVAGDRVSRSSEIGADVWRDRVTPLDAPGIG